VREGVGVFARTNETYPNDPRVGRMRVNPTGYESIRSPSRATARFEDSAWGW
jgi:hypothetical protein